MAKSSPPLFSLNVIIICINEITHQNFKNHILARVNNYYDKHSSTAFADAEELEAWDAEFMKNIDDTTVADLNLARKDLKMAQLMELATLTMAEIKARTVHKDEQKVQDAHQYPALMIHLLFWFILFSGILVNLWRF